MRAFAQALAAEGVSADWFSYVTNPIDISAYTFSTNSVSVDVWLRGGGTSVFTKSANWTVGQNVGPLQEAYFTYGAAVASFLYWSQGPAALAVSNMTVGTKVQPIIYMGNSAGGTSGIVAGQPVTNLATSETLDLTNTHMVRFDPNTSIVKLGFRFTPPTGSPISSSTLGLDFSGHENLIVLRTAAAPA